MRRLNRLYPFFLSVKPSPLLCSHFVSLHFTSANSVPLTIRQTFTPTWFDRQTKEWSMPCRVNALASGLVSWSKFRDSYWPVVDAECSINSGLYLATWSVVASKYGGPWIMVLPCRSRIASCGLPTMRSCMFPMWLPQVSSIHTRKPPFKIGH